MLSLFVQNSPLFDVSQFFRPMFPGFLHLTHQNSLELTGISGTPRTDTFNCVGNSTCPLYYELPNSKVISETFCVT
jgi:hypothetical protein